jgi:tetratricopeptide (TPR) repeat protein
MTDQPPVERDEPQQRSSTESTSHVSGGVNLDAQRDVNVSGDVVGRDKITEIVAGDKVAGDKIVEQQITASGRGIAIGKLNIPVVPLVAALGIGLAALIFIGFITTATQQQIQQLAPTPTPERMSSGKFNVLVAEFGEQAADGTAQPTARGRELSQTVYDNLKAQQQEISRVAIRNSVDLRHVAATATGGLVVDEATAEQAARRVGAQMVIYGALDAQGGFVPKFYVVPEARGQISGISPGNFVIGDEPIRFGGSSEFKANVNLQTRASALFYIIMGITYDFLGLTDQSLEVYREAGDQLKDWAERGQGKEVLYFLWGQAALFKQQQFDCRSEQTASAEWRALNAEARRVFEQALRSNAAYARAMLGLGDASNLQIQCLPKTAEALNSPDLSEMFDRYQQALDRAQADQDHFLRNLAIFSQAGAYYLQGVAYRYSGETASATASFDKAIELLAAPEAYFGDTARQRELAQTYLLQAVVNKQYAETLLAQADQAGARSKYEAAQQDYQRCVDQQARAADDQILSDLIVRDRCQPGLAAVTAALKP